MDMLALLVMGAYQGRENKPDASLLASAELSHLRGRMAQRLAWGLGRPRSCSLCCCWPWWGTQPALVLHLLWDMWIRECVQASCHSCPVCMLPHYGYEKPRSDTSQTSAVGCCCKFLRDAQWRTCTSRLAPRQKSSARVLFLPMCSPKNFTLNQVDLRWTSPYACSPAALWT